MGALEIAGAGLLVLLAAMPFLRLAADGISTWRAAARFSRSLVRMRRSGL